MAPLSSLEPCCCMPLTEATSLMLSVLPEGIKNIYIVRTNYYT
jgi:hypothetical protein